MPKRVHFNIDTDLWKQFKIAAATRGVSMNAALVKMIGDWIAGGGK